jgi:YfiH family protein
VTLEHDVTLHGLRIFRQAHWTERFPSLIQGTTARLPDHAQTSTESEGPSEDEGWEVLAAAFGFERIARCHQIHGRDVVVLDAGLPDTVNTVGDADAIVADREGILLAVTVADCVPVFFVDPGLRLLGLVHAGWRGTAAGVVEAALGTLETLGADPRTLSVHLGPAICGKCYEVGPEVREALGIESAQSRTVDLRAHIVEAAVTAGVDRRLVTTSSACTRCSSGDFYSYRGGDRGQRNIAFLGWPPG